MATPPAERAAELQAALAELHAEIEHRCASAQAALATLRATHVRASVLESVVAEAEAIMARVSEMNRITRALHELHAAGAPGIDLVAIARANDRVGLRLQELFHHVPAADAAGEADDADGAWAAWAAWAAWSAACLTGG